jgi:LytS/YehU family sensor histidine kinase
LILQPLVENAVKHGIGQLLEGGTVRITAQRAGSQLRIRVENNADPDALGGSISGHGIGLVNVRQRVAAAYGRQGSVHWARKDHTFAVDLVLPAQTNEDQ